MVPVQRADVFWFVNSGYLFFSALSHSIKSCGFQVPVAVGIVAGRGVCGPLLFGRVARPPKVFWPAVCVSLNLAADSVPSDGVLAADTGMTVPPPPLWSFTIHDDL